MVKNTFFNPEFRMDFNWSKYHLSVGSVLPHNKKQISEGLRDMSPETIRNRFLGSKREFSEQELQYLTVIDGWNHYAIGIQERENHQKGVAIVRLVRSSHNDAEAEVAVTIIDKYQKMGLGIFLMNLITLAAMERKIDTLSFTFLPQNEAIFKLIQKLGNPLPGPHTKDYNQVYIDLRKTDVEKIKSQLINTLPGIGAFHLKS